MAVTAGVVLRRGLQGENDRLCVLYTADYGKLPVRFPGVNRPRGKLKALSEPLVLGEYRLHMRAGGPASPAAVLCVGGALTTAFPRLRSDLGRLLRGLELCEMVDRLTPVGAPNAEKFSLLCSALDELERSSTPSAAAWVCAAFALRLLREAGFGVTELPVSPRRRPLWERLHHADLAEVARLGEDEALSRLESYLLRSVERVSERPLRAFRMRAQLSTARN